MAPLTRAQKKAALDHVLLHVMQRSPNDDLVNALTALGVDSPHSLISLHNTSINQMVNADGDPIPIAQKALIFTFIKYCIWRTEEGNPINNNWTGITQEEFDEYQVTQMPYHAMGESSPRRDGSDRGSPSSRGSHHTHGTNEASYAILQFKKGIRRDVTAFPILKDERYHDEWHRSFSAQARAQDVQDVLNPLYVPTSDEDTALFQEKQKYLYAVLESKVMTDMGRKFVREHERDGDAQKVYEKLLTHHTRSTKAVIDSSNILAYVTSAKLGEGEWKGSTTSFIINWMDKVRQWEKQCPAEDRFSEGHKRVMLQNAVERIPELRAIKIQSELQVHQTGSLLSYDKYCTLLMSAAQSYDESYKSKMRSKRTVYFHDLGYADDLDGGAMTQDDGFDIDSPVDMIQAYAHDTKRSFENRVRMPRERWMKLTHEQREIWDKLDDKAKAAILGLTSSGGSPPRTPPQRANQHEIESIERDLFEAFASDTTPQREEQPSDEDISTPQREEQGKVLINAAKTGTALKPGDIRRVMSTTSKRYEGAAKSTQSTREVNTATIVYKVTHSNTTAPRNSLIDRGANGGIAGEDVRVVFKTSRSVDIQGIDNHQMRDVDIGTVGGVVNTLKGPVIAIFHQYALHGKGSSIHSCGQMEAFKLDVNDKSVHVGGSQRIKTPEGYVIPLTVRNGLARLKLRPYTDKEWDELPHVFMTGEPQWDPTILDHDPDTEMECSREDEPVDPRMNLFDQYGNYRQRVAVHYASYLNKDDADELEGIIDHCVYHAQSVTLDHIHPYDDEEDVMNNGRFDPSDTILVHEHEQEDDDPAAIPSTPVQLDPREIKKKDPDYQRLRPFFGWLSPSIIKKTFEMTTQLARLPMGTWLKKAFQSPNPALNVHRRNEPVATDIFYSDVPAVDNGATACSIFVGTRSMVPLADALCKT